MTNLKNLTLQSLKIEDDSLKPLAHLHNLQGLYLSNQFETKEYAWLATRLPTTKCKMFEATNWCHIVGGDNRLVLDTIVTGRRKPILLSSKHQAKIESYISEFENLKMALAE